MPLCLKECDIVEVLWKQDVDLGYCLVEANSTENPTETESNTSIDNEFTTIESEQTLPLENDVSQF